MSGVTLDYRLSFAALLAALIGMWLGKKIRYRLNEQLFRRIFYRFGVIRSLYDFALNQISKGDALIENLQIAYNC